MANDLIRTFRKLIQTSTKNPSGYTTTAEVVRVDGDTAWIHIDGGVDQTPAAIGVDCKKGDHVTVRVAGKSATVTGNVTAPPTDDTKAISAEEKAEQAYQRNQNPSCSG